MKIIFDKNLEDKYNNCIFIDIKNKYFGYKKTRYLNDIKFGELICDCTGVNYFNSYTEKITIKIIFNKGLKGFKKYITTEKIKL